MPRHKLERYLNREDFGLAGLSWFVAEEYGLNSDDNIDVKRVGRPILYAPLEDPNLFFSFAKLASRGKPSDKSILRWVRKYGLPQAKIEDKPPFLDNGELNQAPMGIEELAAESLQAHSVLNLHAELDKGDIEALQKRIGKLREAHERWKPLSQIDEKLVEDWGNETCGDGKGSNLPWMAEVELAVFVMNKVEGVRLGLRGSGFWGSSDGSYKPVQALECPDLYSAMYLQFYLLITGDLPMRRCKHPSCRMPFPVTHNNKWFCTPTCRSGMRHHR